MPRIAVVYHKKGEHCEDTAFALALILLRIWPGTGLLLDFVPPDQPRAAVLWEEAARLRAAAGLPHKSGYPLVCIISDEGVVVDAQSVSISEGDALLKMLKDAGFSIIDIENFTGRMVLIREAKVRPAA